MVWRVVVLSGKGGVGKSTVAAFLAEALSKKYKTGLADLDIQTPDTDLLLHGKKVKDFNVTGEGFHPAVYKKPDLEVISLAYQLPEDMAMLWSGGRRADLVIELANKVIWSEDIEVIVIDTPPGTSDEIVATLLTFKKTLLGAILVTTAKDVSLRDVKKTISMCDHLQISLLGVVQNMGHVKCECGKTIPLFDDKDVEKELGVPVIASIPFKKNLSTRDFRKLVKLVIDQVEARGGSA